MLLTLFSLDEDVKIVSLIMLHYHYQGPIYLYSISWTSNGMLQNQCILKQQWSNFIKPYGVTYLQHNAGTHII